MKMNEEDVKYATTALNKSFSMFLFMILYCTAAMSLYGSIVSFHNGATGIGIKGLIFTGILLPIGLVYNKRCLDFKRKLESIKETWSK